MRFHLPLAVLGTTLLIVLAGCAGDPQNVTVTIEAPTSVKKGERFDIHARVHNTDSKSQQLVSLDISEKYLEGIHIESAEPAFSEASHIPVDNTMSYKFDLDVPAGQEKVVTLHAVALKTGDFSGGTDFCINTDHTFLTQQLRTVVE